LMKQQEPIAYGTWVVVIHSEDRRPNRDGAKWRGEKP
jgi:hypothetical protein